MYGKFREALEDQLEEITRSGLYKSERRITSAQEARIRVGEQEVLNLCANNYIEIGRASCRERV